MAAGTSHDGSEQLLHDLTPDLRQGWLRRWPGPSVVSAPFFPQVAHAGESTERSLSGRCGGVELSSSGTPDDRGPVPPSSAGGPARYTINSTSVTLTDPDAAPRLGREALLALARWMAQGDERSGSSRSTTVDGPSERATGSDPRGAAPDGVAQSPAGTASPGGGR